MESYPCWEKEIICIKCRERFTYYKEHLYPVFSCFDRIGAVVERYLKSVGLICLLCEAFNEISFEELPKNIQNYLLNQKEF